MQDSVLGGKITWSTKFLRTIIEWLLKFPKNCIIDLAISKLLNYIKEAPIKTRYGFRIHFKVTSTPPTGIRKEVILGRYEDSYLDMMARLVEPGDYIIDGGAHEGCISMFMSRVVGNNGRVFSIEPNPENLNFIRRNIELNSIKNIVVIDKAISDKSSKASFFYDDDRGA